VYDELIRKICGSEVHVVARVAGDRVQLMRKLRGLLRSLEHANPVGGPVEKALAIRDADGKSVAGLENAMRDSVAGQALPFGVEVHAVRQEMEAWLLADPVAINRVAVARGGRPVSSTVKDPEDILSPSAKFREVLSSAGLNYTAQVCREIAREIDLATLRARCPTFRVFEKKVLDP